MRVYFLIFLFSLFYIKNVESKKRSHSKLSDHKIVGGTNATIAAYPYQAYLLLQRGTTYYQCGGSIISSRAVLTAAHCMVGILQVFIRVGSTNSSSGGVEYSSSLYLIHPLYSSRRNDYDVAVIKVLQGMNLDGVNARPVPLPSRGASIPAGTNVVVTGWGTTNESGDTSTTLMAVTVPTITNEECNQRLNGITARMFCAGEPEGGKDSCQGDSGGPAVNQETGVQLGIVSFGVGCARPGYPGVYTRIAAVRSWIRLNAGV